MDLGNSELQTTPNNASRVERSNTFDHAEIGVLDNEKLTWQNSVGVLKRTGLLMSNLASVYYLEYLITTGLTVAIGGQLNELNADKKGTFIYDNTFVIFNFCYQTGVFISRSSLGCVKIKHVWLLTLFQFLNCAFWLSNALHMYCFNIYVYFVHIVFVGLMGGASYVNVIYRLKNSPKLAKTEKELAMNLLSCFDDLGVLLAAITALILTTTVFAQYSKD